MAVTTAQTLDIAQVLADLLAGVEGLRVEQYVADKSRPPVAVIGQPDINFQDPDSGFCWASWEFPITIITARNNDRDAQRELSRLVRDVVNALTHPTVDDVYDITCLDARPITTALIAGQELPAYLVRCLVRA